MSGFDEPNEPSREDVAKYMRQMQGEASPQPQHEAYITSDDGLTKYSGPLAVKEYDGPKANDPETGNLCMHGEGSVVFANGSTYEGGFLYDKLHGRGVLKDPNGNVYNGEWNEDLREGKAIMTMKDGSTYDGYYKANKRHGKGKDVDAAGNTFDGVFEFGDPVRGKLEYAEGDVYIGELNKDWDRHGQGKFISIDTGTVQHGLWELDAFKG